MQYLSTVLENVLMESTICHTHKHNRDNKLADEDVDGRNLISQNLQNHQQPSTIFINNIQPLFRLTKDIQESVSYTHLTLPTILLV